MKTPSKLIRSATLADLEVCRLVDGKWLQLGVYGADEKVRGEPFEAVEIDLAEWWEGIDEDEEDDG